MEPRNNIAWIHMMDRPTFCVRDGRIVDANQAARDRLIPLNQPVEPLLVAGRTAYREFADGYLSLTIQLSGKTWPAMVRRVEEYDVFTLEPDNAGAELQVLALAAQKLRKPLTGIFATMEQMEGAEDAENLAHLNQGLYQLLRIVQNMDDITRWINEPPRLDLMDVNAVMEEIFERAAELCELCQVRLEFVGLKTPAYSLIDSSRLVRCVYRILSNSLQFTGQGGTIRAMLTRRGNILYLTIQDSGSGIGPNAGNNLFDRYLREPSLEDISQGLGLGLPLIRAFANAHGGTVILQSTDRGVRLTLSLPMRQDTTLRSPVIRPDDTGGRDIGLVELSEVLPYDLYCPDHLD